MVNYKNAEDLNESESFYLHGACDDYIKQIFQEGDEILAVTEVDFEINKECLCHAFIHRNGLYIDVRGTSMSSIDEVMLEEFGFSECDIYTFDEEYSLYSFWKLADFESFVNEHLKIITRA